jgi:hypothetical protein
VKSKFALVQFRKSKIKCFIIRNARYLNRILVTFETEIFLSDKFYGAMNINTRQLVKNHIGQFIIYMYIKETVVIMM